MSGNDDARTFLESLVGYMPGTSTPTPASAPTRLGTVTAIASGAATVRFDGEAAPGARTYLTISPIATGDRVLLVAVGSTYVIIGRLGAAAAPVTPFRMAAGTVTTGSNIGTGSATAFGVTFPAGRFTVPPLVVPTSDISRLTMAASSITTTGCDLVAGNYSGATVTSGRVLSYHAIQMTPTSAAG